MKKSVTSATLSTGLIFTAFILQFTAGNAQVCTPDPQYTQPGIYPDSITNLDSGMVGVPYSDTITAIVPADTVDNTGNCCNPVQIDSMVVTGVTGLPPGLTYQCEPPSCGFPGGTSGCMLISGTPTDTGTFNISAAVTGYVRCCLVFTGCASCTQAPVSSTVDYYKIVIEPAPALLSASVTASTDVDCKGNCNGQATVTAAGGTQPYTYLWNDPSAQTTAVADSLCAGNYTVTVIDAVSDTVTASVVINEPANALSSGVSGTDETSPGANDGTAEVVASGGTGPYAYSWNTTPVQTTDSIGGLAPNTYTVTVTDANGCTFVGSVIVNPSGCTLLTDSISSTDETSAGSKDGTATVYISGGTPPYTYNWGIDTIINTDTVSTIDSLGPGNYTVTVTDAGGCSKTETINVGAGPSGVQPFDDLANRVSVYPNPAFNELNIIAFFDEQVIFYIYDIVGKQIKGVAIENEITKVKTAELARGMYIYQILNKQGLMLNRGKFSIAR